MDRLESALSDLATDLDRAEHLLGLIKQLRGFGASTVPASRENGGDPWPEAVELWEEAKKRRTDVPLLAGSLLLYLAGRFEHFARLVVEIGAEEIAEQCQEFSQLPERLRKALIQQTAEVARSPKRFGCEDSEVEGFIVCLADCLRASSSIPSINSKCLSATETNLRPDVLAELMKRIGMDGIWADFGKQTRAKLFLQTTGDSETSVEARNRLNALMDERNRIAHPTAGTVFPDPDQVLAGAKFFRVLGDVMVDIVRVYVAGFANKRKGK